MLNAFIGGVVSGVILIAGMYGLSVYWEYKEKKKEVEARGTHRRH